MTRTAPRACAALVSSVRNRRHAIAPLPFSAMPKYQFSVHVKSAFAPEHSDPAQQRYTFTYTVTVQNTGEVAAQLISRHWIISDLSGRTEEVKGLGVVGHQPLLQPGEAFEYTSGCQLRNPTGAMHGSYFCVAEDGARFDVPIPEFTLDTDGNGHEGHVLH
jgi:ApaG protein